MKHSAVYYWSMLLIAIMLELTGTSSMKFFTLQGGSEGYITMISCMLLSYFALSKAVVRIPISLAYAVWEGVGLIGTVFIAWFVFHEPMPPLKILGFFIILSGLVMIKLGTSVPAKEAVSHDQ